MMSGKLTLLYQSHSPYARKVLVSAHETGLANRLDVIHHETSPTNRNDAVFAWNPLGKVPVLLTPDADALFDSVVICDYLDRLAGEGSLIPRDGPARYEALRLQALAQGLCDAGIAVRWETERRPETLRYPPLAEGQTTKLVEAYDYPRGAGRARRAGHGRPDRPRDGPRLAQLPAPAELPHAGSKAVSLVRPLQPAPIDARHAL